MSICHCNTENICDDDDDGDDITCSFDSGTEGARMRKSKQYPRDSGRALTKARITWERAIIEKDCINDGNRFIAENRFFTDKSEKEAVKLQERMRKEAF